MDMEYPGAMKRFFSFTLTFLSVAMVTPAYSELRILFSFDETGHQVHQLTRVEARDSFRSLPDESRSAPVLPSFSIDSIELQPGEATLVWQDGQLAVIDVTRVPDPRILHSPGHIAGLDAASRVGARAGAWLVDAPDNAKHVVILLPANPNLYLASEQWPLWLEPAGG